MYKFGIQYNTNIFRGEDATTHAPYGDSDWSAHLSLIILHFYRGWFCTEPRLLLKLYTYYVRMVAGVCGAKHIIPMVVKCVTRCAVILNAFAYYSWVIYVIANSCVMQLCNVFGTWKWWDYSVADNELKTTRLITISLQITMRKHFHKNTNKNKTWATIQPNDDLLP